MRARTSLIAVAALAGLLATGCVSNKKFEGTVSDMTGRIDGLQTEVETHGEEISDLKKMDGELQSDLTQVKGKVGDVDAKSDKALETANTAYATAKGKVIWKVTLTNKDVKFAVDGTEINESGASILNDLVAKLKSFDKMVFVEIQGHTDATGGEAYNMQLGHKRAEVVRNYLHEKGIPLNLLSVISYGESRPVADNSSREGRTANRRVEILVLE
jgi:outer membrane protein OmpA-like peptidoglycan-associated protein